MPAADEHQPRVADRARQLVHLFRERQRLRYASHEDMRGERVGQDHQAMRGVADGFDQLDRALETAKEIAEAARERGVNAEDLKAKAKAAKKDN